MAMTEVLKFGGTSVATSESWQNIRSILDQKILAWKPSSNGQTLWLVCSAVAGVSDVLEKFCLQPKSCPVESLLEQVWAPHQKLIDELDFGSQSRQVVAEEWSVLERLVRGVELLDHCPPKIQAQVLSFGELILTRLLCEWLRTKIDQQVVWVDPRSVFVSSHLYCGDERDYLSAQINLKLSRQSLQSSSFAQPSTVYIMGGFVAASEDSQTVVLGRGGSDTSAAYLAGLLQASCLEIWTDVPGIFTADPRRLKSARLIRGVNYDEAAELAACGAKVLHPRCIAPLKESNIPLFIRWTARPDDLGVRIERQGRSMEPALKAIAVKENVHLISMESVQMVGMVGFLSKVFPLFEKYGFSIDLVGTSQTNVTVTLDLEDMSESESRLEYLMKDLESFCKPTHQRGLSTLYLVGHQVRKLANELSSALKVFEQVDVYLISQASSDLNFALTVRSEHLDSLLQTLHELFFSGVGHSEAFGPTWSTLFSETKQLVSATHSHQPWWQSKREQLLSLAQGQSPLYVYSLSVVRQQLLKLVESRSVDRIHYAIKANSDPQILNCVASMGQGFDCVSFEELQHVKASVAGMDMSKVVFTPNFAPIEEYRQAFQMGVAVTVDNLWLIENYPEDFVNRKILVRVDIGLSAGHHPKVRTGGAQSKFGLSLEQLESFVQRVHHLDSEIIGVHAHIGSGIMTPDTWAMLAKMLIQTAEKIPSVRILNLGGGIGVPVKEDDQGFDIESFAKPLQKIRQDNPDFKVWIEPGRFLVAESGVLLSRFTQSKMKQGKRFIGLDAGMNALLRPALYSAYHPIVNLSKLGCDAKHHYADIVGPICETGDTLGFRRLVAEPEKGDVFLIANAGAYGEVMKQSYNLRTLAESVVLE